MGNKLDIILNEELNKRLLLIEMAKCGQIDVQSTVYQLAVWGGPTHDRDIPHLHIYIASDAKNSYSNFNLEVSLVDLLTENKWVLLKRYDKYNNINDVFKTENWQPYTKLLKSLKKDVFSGPLTIGKATYIDRLDYIISVWNYERNQTVTEHGGNPLKEWLDDHNLIIMPQYEKYFKLNP
jgi:hypothetical protein